MEIPREAVGEYSRRIDACAVGARRRVEELVLAWARENPDASPEETRDAAIAIMEQVERLMGDAAATQALAFHEEVMGAEGVRAVNGTLYDGPDAGEIDDAARYQAGKCLFGEKPDVAGFAAAMGEAAENHVRRAERETVAKAVEAANKGRDKRVRFARVPTGAETCTYCAMLASRGFVYRTAGSAGSSGHKGCNCKVVSGVGGQTSIDGYDPDDMYEVWQAYEDIDAETPEGDDGEPLKGARLEAWRRQRKLEALREKLGRDTWDGEGLRTDDGVPEFLESLKRTEGAPLDFGRPRQGQSQLRHRRREMDT